jgi:hypothetical protein
MQNYFHFSPKRGTKICFSPIHIVFGELILELNSEMHVGLHVNCKKGKVVQCAQLIKHYVMKEYGGVDV